MSCPRIPGFACPMPASCRGRSEPAICRHLARLAANRRDRPGPEVPDAPPGPVAMAKSFARAMRDLVADGGRLAPRPVRRARRAACESCPHHDPDRDACKLCGCGSVVPGGLKAKRAIASSVCPDSPPRFGPC